jgi:hypothetical protein
VDGWPGRGRDRRPPRPHPRRGRVITEDNRCDFVDVSVTAVEPRDGPGSSAPERSPGRCAVQLGLAVMADLSRWLNWTRNLNVRVSVVLRRVGYGSCDMACELLVPLTGSVSWTSTNAAAEPPRVLPRLVYLTLCRSIQALALLARGDTAKDLEILVLRHQLTGPPRSTPEARARRPRAARRGQSCPAPRLLVVLSRHARDAAALASAAGPWRLDLTSAVE